MAPHVNIPFSPAELSYLRSSLTQTPPVRPDGRQATQFRPLIAESDILPSANGSARICFADGTEAIVGVKAEVEKSKDTYTGDLPQDIVGQDAADVSGSDSQGARPHGSSQWLEVAIEIPGMRDDDPLPIFLAAMLSEAVLADGRLRDRLYINSRYHWRLYIDILLLSQPLSYPLPLLSLTTHLALLSTKMPALISEQEEDPLFNDDWEASTYLYPRGRTEHAFRPPVTLLVVSVGDNIIFDPAQDELAVADFVTAISIVQAAHGEITIVAIRTIDPPSRLTSAGVPNALNMTVNGGVASVTSAEALALRETDEARTVWRLPRGGIRRDTLTRMTKAILEKGGVGHEVLDGLTQVRT